MIRKDTENYRKLHNVSESYVKGTLGHLHMPLNLFCKPFFEFYELANSHVVEIYCPFSDTSE